MYLASLKGGNEAKETEGKVINICTEVRCMDFKAPKRHLPKAVHMAVWFSAMKINWICIKMLRSGGDFLWEKIKKVRL